MSGVITTCARCGVGYDAGLVRGLCPVCGTPASGHQPRRTGSTDTAMYLVAAATIGNLLVLSVLAVYLLR